jgi:hypothetical protein
MVEWNEVKFDFCRSWQLAGHSTIVTHSSERVNTRTCTKGSHWRDKKLTYLKIKSLLKPFKTDMVNLIAFSLLYRWDIKQNWQINKKRKSKERTAAEWVARPNKETALMAILRWLLFHWSVMTWFHGMDTRLRLGRERFERVVSEPRSPECSCCLTKSNTWFNLPPPYTFYCFGRISGPDFGLQNRGILRFPGRISCMYMAYYIIIFERSMYTSFLFLCQGTKR